MIKKFLKQVNSMPFAFTMKHYLSFGELGLSLPKGELNSKEAWDELRKSHPNFSISTNREEWLKATEAEVRKDGQDGGLLKRADDLAGLLKKENAKSIFSVGSGGAGLEYQIKKILPWCQVTCSEFSLVNVERLSKVFSEANNVIQFDIINGDWDSVNKKYIGDEGICLMYRVDASFNDSEWRKIFESMHTAHVSKIIFIPSGFLTILSIWNRKMREIKWAFSLQKTSFSGYLRTKKRFTSYWDGLYDAEEYDFGGFKGFLLKKI